MALPVLVSRAGTLRYDERPGHRRECFGYSHFRLQPQFSRQEAIADTVNPKAALAIDASYYGDMPACVSPVLGEPTMKADPAYGVRYAEEQVVTLPQDQETPYLTVFGERSDPRVQNIVKWFDTNRTLAGIKGQTHFNVIYADMPMFRDRYASTVQALPCVRLQANNEDEPVAEFSGTNVPMTADALARGLNTRATNAECFRRRHVCPPVTPIVPPVVPPVTPPIVPPPPVPRPANLTWLVIVLLGVLGGIAGAARYFSDLYHGRKV